MLNVYGNAIQRADQTDGYFIMSSIRKTKKREDEKVKKSKGERMDREEDFLIAAFFEM